MQQPLFCSFACTLLSTLFDFLLLIIHLHVHVCVLGLHYTSLRLMGSTGKRNDLFKATVPSWMWDWSSHDPPHLPSWLRPSTPSLPHDITALAHNAQVTATPLVWTSSALDFWQCLLFITSRQCPHGTTTPKEGSFLPTLYVAITNRQLLISWQRHTQVRETSSNDEPSLLHGPILDATIDLLLYSMNNVK